MPDGLGQTETGMRTGSFLRTATLGLGLILGTYTAASAGTLPFTWNPSATGDSSVGAFTADRFDLSDYAAITVPSNPAPAGSVSERGYLFPTVFRNGTAVTSTANLTAGTWGIYESFTATSHLTPCSGGFCGSFDSITASVYVYSTAHGVASVTFSAGVPILHLPSAASPKLIASETGPIGGSPNTATIQDGVPGASVDTLFTPTTTYPGFFVNPPDTQALDLEQAFINTTGVTRYYPAGCATNMTYPCIYEIDSGGGNGNFFTVPEPASIGVFAMSLAALGFIRRRRKA